MQQLFKHLTIIELSSVLAGPAVGMFFAELGATVHKIENPNSGGDITRQWRLPQEDPHQMSAYYQSINWNKNTLFVDLKNKKEREKVYSLIKTADIVISNFQDAQAEKLGMSSALIFQLNPKIIFAQIYAYDQQDVRKGFDVVMQAESGFLSMTGSIDGEPAKVPVALIDLIAAHQLKEAILLAMLQQTKDGKGKRVEVSLFKSAIASLINQASNYLVAGHIPQRMGTQHPNIAPYGDAFSTGDGAEGIFAVGSDRQFETLCNVLGLQEEFRKKFARNQIRVQERDILMARLQAECLRFSKIELNQLLIRRGIPFGWIKSLDEVFEDKMAAEMILKNGNEKSCVSSISFQIHDA